MRKMYLQLLPVFLLFTYTLKAQSPENGYYNDWNYSQAGVFGLVKLQKTTLRPYYKLSKTDASIKIQRYNSAGIVTITTLIRMVNGKINSMTSTNRWGQTYETTKFTAAGPNEFIVTRKYTGKNDFLPCKAAKYIYKNNLLTEIRYIGYNNKLSANASGVAITKYKRYDDKNRYSLIKEMSFYDEQGLPVVSSSYDCHKVLYQYNERANEVAEAYYGQDGEALTSRFGGFKLTYAYNENDLLIRTETIGLNEDITLNSNGIAVTEYQYNNGLVSGITRYDDKQMVTKASATGDGVARILYEYDEQGNEITRSFFDEYGKPMNNNTGYHLIKSRYNQQGMLTEIAYFDKDKNAFNTVDGIHRYSYIKDAKNNTVQVAFFDKNDNPVSDKTDQVYMRKYRYDEFGRTTSTSYWKNESTKMARWNGYYEYVVTYNDDGQITELIYLDDNGNLFKSTTGYSKEVRVYNSNASLSERKWFDGNTPVLLTNAMATGFHYIKYTDDEKGRASILMYYDTDGKPTNASIDMEADKTMECNKIEFFYQGNRIVEERLYKVGSSTPFKVIDCIHNDYISVSGISKGYKNQ